ncbi:APC amino acid permease [Russula aff. rugulosa BPL654]|nr:APC amino acid permease [Russula aff. rugulosa BPL654]
MGYKQELKRDLTLLQNFGFSFSIISVITGIPSLFLFGLTTGGPAVMVWGWVVVAFFTMLVGLAMAEICSAHPTSGGPYFWAAMISKPKGAPFASWVTGWFNLLGQVAITTGIRLVIVLTVTFACANFISTAATIGTNYKPNSHKTIGIYAAVLISQGAINTFGVRILKYLNNISVWWHALGTTSLAIAILAAAPKHQSGKFVFRTFIDGTGVDGVGWSQRASPAYVAVIGILLAQYTMTDSQCGHGGPIGIITAIGVSAILGWFLILSLLFSIQDYGTTVASPTGQPVTQIFLDTVGKNGAIVLMVIVIGAMFFCGTFSITSNSRMMYAFSRDGAIPGSKFLHKVDRRWRSPIRTVWLACTLSFILGLPSLGSSVAFSAATSIATIGLYISYGTQFQLPKCLSPCANHLITHRIPIALRVIYADRFIRGPFHLGRFSYPISIAAVLWIAFISIVFCLPELYPVNSQTLNYAPVAVGIVISYALGFWAISARRWFAGPINQIAEEEMGISVTGSVVISDKPESLEKSKGP